MKTTINDDCTEEQPGSCANRYKMITEKLYSCLIVHSLCSHRINYGNSNFCTWLLRNDDGRTIHNFPCSKDDQT